MRKLQRFWAEFRSQPGILQYGEWLVLLMVAFLLLLPAPARAGEMTATYGTNRVTVSDRPCTHAGTLAHIKPEAREHYRMARGMIDGKDFYGCWRAFDVRVFVTWEDGEFSALAMADFSDEKPGI